MSLLTLDSNDHVYAFDGFTLDPSRRQLVRGEDHVPLGGRALDLLIALVEQAGDILSREHLTARVWPRTVVEESSLRVHMAALRRALGDGRGGGRYITTIPGRGYGFIANVIRRPRFPATQDVAQAGPSPVSAQHWQQVQLLGREHALLALTRLLHESRLVTLVGPGGVGKTSVALHWAARSSMPPRVVDLASAACEADVMRQLAAALQVCATADLWPAAVDMLRRSPGLLIVDSCEHVIEAAARLIDALLAELPELRLLATSREPLNVAGEQVYRLETLALPAGRPASLDEALDAPAVRLLAERARASGNDVVFDDADAAALCELAQQLDGLPLALELGAARIRALGLNGMLNRADELNALLTRGRRTALPRHRSLDANIGWSYELLEEAERRTLRALSVFPGKFSLASAAAIVSSAPGDEGAIEEQVLRLVEKSLVFAAPNAWQAGSAGECTAYRLPNTTRRYAALQLRSDAGEARQVGARHALDLLRRLEATPAESGHFSSSAAGGSSSMDELRQALHACLSGGDETLGVRLLKAGLPLIRKQDCAEEFQPAIERALALGTCLGVAPLAPARTLADAGQ